MIPLKITSKKKTEKKLRKVACEIKKKKKKVSSGRKYTPSSRIESEFAWIRKLWYIYTMEYYSAIKKNSFESILMRWMKLEPIIQSEVSQKDKDHYNILTHIYGI